MSPTHFGGPGIGTEIETQAGARPTHGRRVRENPGGGQDLGLGLNTGTR